MPPQPSTLLRTIYVILALLFTALAVYGSLVPFQYEPTEFADAWQAFTRDFQTWTAGGSRVDLGVNSLLFIPISFFWLQVCAGGSKSWLQKMLAIGVVVVGCLTVSVGIEFAQTWFPPRVPTALDVLAQAFGTGVGVLIWLAAGATISDWLQIYLSDRRPTQQIHWLFQAYAIGLVIYSLMPLDLALGPQDVYRKLNSGRFVLLPFSSNYGGILNFMYTIAGSVLTYVPIGMLAATTLTTAARPVRRFPAALLVGFGFVLGIEIAQIFVMTRFTDTTDLISGSIGVAIGIWLFKLWRGTAGAGGAERIEPASVERPAVAGRWLIIAGLYAVVLVILYWAPFDFTYDKQKIRDGLNGFFNVPLSSAVRGSPFGAITAIVRKVLLFVPLGVMFCLTARPLPTRFRRLLLGVLILIGWSLALGIELGQIVLPNRAATFDDVFICSLGTILGIFFTSRIIKGQQMAGDQSAKGFRQ